MKVTIKDIMELPVFKDARVVSGYGGMHKEVSSMTVAEVPDAADWLKGGELVVTTGYFIKDNCELQGKWIADLIRGGAAALAIKPDRFLGTTPPQMIELADEHNFCLIELPNSVTWPTVMESVMNTISNNQNQIIKRTEEIHNKLTEIVLMGYGLPSIAKTISQLVNNIIVVEDVALGILAVSGPEDNSEMAEDFLSYRLSNDYKHSFNSTEYYANVLKHSHKNTYELKLAELNPKFENVSQITIPIVADSIAYGFITLVELYKKANQVDIVALEHGATTIALEMMKEKIVFETEKRLKRGFLDDLLEGRINGDLNGMGKYNIIGFDTTRPAVAIILDIDGIDNVFEINSKVFRRGNDNKLVKLIESCIKDRDPSAFVNDENNRFAMLYHFSINSEKTEILDDIRKLCEKISKRISKDFPNATYNFGVGNIYYQMANLRKSYKEAKKALEIGKLFMGENQIFLFNELGIYRLLFMIDKKEEIVEFCIDTIGPLLEHDKKNDDNLCHCLETFLLNNGNIAKTSKDLYIHSNTLAYRLKKISAVIGKDINDSKIRFNLYFALMIKKLFLDR